jgi:putative ABC transport system permease protein
MLPIVVIAVIIALFGLMNSLLASVIDRVREIGLIRAVGGTRRQVARLVTIEAMTLGLIAGALSIPLGIGFFYFDVLAQRTVTANGLFFRMPSLPVALLIVVGASITAALAGYLPAREAAKVRITEALQTE